MNHSMILSIVITSILFWPVSSCMEKWHEMLQNINVELAKKKVSETLDDWKRLYIKNDTKEVLHRA